MEPISVVGRARRLSPPSQRTRTIALTLALVLFTGSTILALAQDSWTDAQTPPAGFAWWLKPRNPPADLTQVGAHLRAVWALPDNHHVWAGGDYAMLLHSHDEGRTWSQIKVNIPAPQPTAAPVNKPSVIPTKTSPAAPNPAPGKAVSKAQELPPAQNPAAQAPLDPANQTPPSAPYGIASPSAVAPGATVRMQITTVNFRIEKPNASISISALVRIGTPELSKDPSLLIVPVTVDPKATPGRYNIRISGVRVPGGAPYELDVYFTVTSAAKSAAGLFSLIPSVYAAEPTAGPRGSASGVSIMSVQFNVESSGSLDLDSDVTLGTRDGGSKWDPKARSSAVQQMSGCAVAPDLSGPPGDAEQCWGVEVIQVRLTEFKIFVPPSLDHWQSLFVRHPNSDRVWIGGLNGSILEWDGGPDWQIRNAPTKARINGLFFQPDGKRGWAVGSSGVIFSTADGGQHWTARTHNNDTPYKAPYSPGPAPWYVFSLLLTAMLAGIALLSPEAPVAPPATVEIIGASDRPLEDDRDPDPLAFRPIARGIAYFIRNRRTTPPLNFAITGPWGCGKTSLMRLLRHELVKYGFRPVWFNAWHHQSEDYLLPSLLETIRQEAVPKLWNRGGIGFRLRLLNARWQWWFVVLGLCFAGAVAFTALPNLQVTDPFSLLKRFGPHGVAIGSVITMLSFLYRWLTAFGVKPAALLSSSGGGARVSDLEKQTSFRYRFAKEFREVTQALRTRQMVIFIDDLDRCQPQNTLEVLESVNFLSSSGECFVVMGMAKELVQEYVSGSLEGAAKALTAVAPAGVPCVTAHDLAGEYLQKLINIEVPVPATDADEMKRLVNSLKTGTEGLAGEPSLLSAVRGIAAVLVPLVLAGSLLYEGAKLGGYLAGQIGASGTIATQGSDKKGNQASAAPADNPGQAAAPTAPAEGPENDTFSLLKIQSSWASLWWALMVVPALFWAGYRIATWRPDLEPDDSKEFTYAMEDALPLILDRQRTPRAVKRFVNKVRFIAMRQRQAFRDDRPLWRQILQPQLPDTAPSPAIPEDILVILAALHQWKSSSVEDGVNLGRAVAQWSLKYDAAVLEAWRGRYLEFAAGLRAS